jgi:hypothetical protein
MGDRLRQVLMIVLLHLYRLDLEYILETVPPKQQNNYGVRFHRYIVNVQFITHIFGQLTNKYCQVKGIVQSVRIVVRQVILSDSITPCANEFHA